MVLYRVFSRKKYDWRYCIVLELIPLRGSNSFQATPIKHVLVPYSHRGEILFKLFDKHCRPSYLGVPFPPVLPEFLSRQVAFVGSCLSFIATGSKLWLLEYSSFVEVGYNFKNNKPNETVKATRLWLSKRFCPFGSVEASIGGVF